MHQSSTAINTINMHHLLRVSSQRHHRRRKRATDAWSYCRRSRLRSERRNNSHRRRNSPSSPSPGPQARQREADCRHLLAVKTTGRERKRKGDGAHDGWTEEAENEKGKGGGPWWSPIDINRERERGMFGFCVGVPAVYVYVGVYM